MKKIFLSIFFCFFILISGTLSVDAKEFKVNYFSCDDSISAGDTIVFPEDLKFNYRYGQYSIDEIFYFNPSSVVVDGVKYFFEAPSDDPKLLDLFQINLLENNYRFQMPTLNEISKLDFSKYEFYKISDDYAIDLSDEERLNLFNEMSKTDMISYNVCMRIEGLGSYFFRVDTTFIFDHRTININYENTLDCNNENPKFYRVSDGTIKLLPLEKEGYVFEGWYLDEKYQYRVEELSSDMNGDLVLYAKWTKVDENIFTNPETYTPIIVVLGVVVLTGVVTAGVIYYRKKINNTL